ncbi:hypothetical protein F4677DRAFT_429684 [Hypoxylon crocopeplum]|nr:hypothetical protein F4677DRAFT_429684 [Hypoxylon crocopeplum]
MDGSYWDSTLPSKEESQSEKILATLQSIQSLLEKTENNTSRVFWWSSTVVQVILALFVLGTLIRMRNELMNLIDYQELFRRTWATERKREQTRREKQETENRKRHAAQAAAAASSRNRMAGLDGTMPYPQPSPKVDAFLKTHPTEPGPAREEWTRNALDMARDIMRNSERERQPGEGSKGKGKEKEKEKEEQMTMRNTEADCSTGTSEI